MNMRIKEWLQAQTGRAMTIMWTQDGWYVVINICQAGEVFTGDHADLDCAMGKAFLQVISAEIQAENEELEQANS